MSCCEVGMALALLQHLFLRACFLSLCAGILACPVAFCLAFCWHPRTSKACCIKLQGCFAFSSILLATARYCPDLAVALPYQVAVPCLLCLTLPRIISQICFRWLYCFISPRFRYQRVAAKIYLCIACRSPVIRIGARPNWFHYM